MWDDLVRGAIGAIILVDVRRLQDSFAAVDFFEHRNLPFLIAVNEFDGAPRYPTEEVRKALTLGDGTPVITVDARDRKSATDALIAISEYALAGLAPTQPSRPAHGPIGNSTATTSATRTCPACRPSGWCSPNATSAAPR